MEGPYIGHVATVNSCVGQFRDCGEMVLEPGYQVTLDGDWWVTVWWDALETII